MLIKAPYCKTFCVDHVCASSIKKKCVFFLILNSLLPESVNLDKKYVICLIVISLTSLFFKLYTTDLFLPVNSDNLSYTLHAISVSHGNLAQNPQRGSGWPLFSSMFLTFVNSENLIDYSVVMRLLSLGISIVTILPVYLLGAKFFAKKYALLIKFVI